MCYLNMKSIAKKDKITYVEHRRSLWYLCCLKPTAFSLPFRFHIFKNVYQGTLNFKFSSVASRELHQRECLSSFIIPPHSSDAGRFMWYSPKLRINWPFKFRIQYCLNQNLPNCLLPKLKKASPECFIVERYMHSFDTVDSQSHASSLIKFQRTETSKIANMYLSWPVPLA